MANDKGKIQVPLFDPDKGDKAKTWVHQVERCRRAAGRGAPPAQPQGAVGAYNWSETATANYALLAMRGVAAEWSENLEENDVQGRDEWATLKPMILERFHVKATWSEKTALIVNLKQRNSEPVLNFKDRVESAVNTLFEGWTARPDTDAQNLRNADIEAKKKAMKMMTGSLFAAGLRSEIREFVVSQDLADIDALAKAAVRVEACKNKRTQESRMEMIAEVDDVVAEEEVAAVRKKSFAPNNAYAAKKKPFNGNCNYCKKFGHMKMDCFARINAEKKKKQTAAVSVEQSLSAGNGSEINALDVAELLNNLLA